MASYESIVWTDLPVQSESLTKLPNTVWEREIGNEKFWYEDKVMAVSKENGIFITTKARLAPWVGNSKTNSIWLWRLNEKGEKLDEINIKNPQADKKDEQLSYSDIRGLTIHENGGAILLVEFGLSHPWIVRIDKLGKLILTKELGGPGRQISISKIIPSADGNYLLIGHESFDSLAMKIDAGGNILWEKKDDRGKKELFVDGVLTDDGGFVLIGNSGDLDLQGSTSILWVGRYDAKGKLVSEKTFEGQNGSIARSQDKSYAVVYDKVDSGNQEIWVRSFSADLKELWVSNILSRKPGVSNIRIAAVPSGDFIVSGSVASQNFNLWVTRIAKGGKKIWDFLDHNKISANYSLVSLNDEFYILFTAYKELEDRKISKKVGLIKFIQK